MGKAEQTHQRIIRQAAPLFNQFGYNGTSIDDIMHAANLKKGGIYSHFQSKEEIALAAFDHFAMLMHERMSLFLIQAATTAFEQLLASINAFASVVSSPPVAGGCMMLNTAIESDDALPVFKHRTRQAMDVWFELIRHLISEGIRKQEFRPEVDGEEVASTIIASLEGALMLSKLYDDPVYMQRVVKHLRSYLLAELVK